MKPQTYLRLLLLVPYLLWGIVLALTQLHGGNANPSMPDGTLPRLLILLPYIYLIGVIFWLIPYTLLAVGLLVWSIKRQANTILIVFALSPLMLTALMLLEINLLSLATQGFTYSLADSNVSNLMALNQVVIFAGLLVGYFCVAIGLGSYKMFQSLKLIKDTETRTEPLLKEAV